MDEQLKQIIDRGVAAGLSDEDIGLLVQEHKRRFGGPEGALGVDPADAPSRGGVREEEILNRAMDDGRRLTELVMPGPLAGAGIPGVIGRAASRGGEMIRSAAKKTLDVLEDPCVSSGIGGIEGYRRTGTLEGAAMGAATGGITGRAVSRLRGAVAPGVVATAEPGMMTSQVKPVRPPQLRSSGRFDEPVRPDVAPPPLRSTPRSDLMDEGRPNVAPPPLRSTPRADLGDAVRPNVAPPPLRSTPRFEETGRPNVAPPPLRSTPRADLMDAGKPNVAPPPLRTTPRDFDVEGASKPPTSPTTPEPARHSTTSKVEKFTRNDLQVLKDEFGTMDIDEASAKFGPDVVRAKLAEKKKARSEQHRDEWYKRNPEKDKTVQAGLKEMLEASLKRRSGKK